MKKDKQNWTRAARGKQMNSIALHGLSCIFRAGYWQVIKETVGAKGRGLSFL
jgi:hypothetical protein